LPTRVRCTHSLGRLSPFYARLRPIASIRQRSSCRIASVSENSNLATVGGFPTRNSLRLEAFPSFSTSPPRNEMLSSRGRYELRNFHAPPNDAPRKRPRMKVPPHAPTRAGPLDGLKCVLLKRRNPRCPIEAQIAAQAQKIRLAIKIGESTANRCASKSTFSRSKRASGGAAQQFFVPGTVVTAKKKHQPAPFLPFPPARRSVWRAPPSLACCLPASPWLYALPHTGHAHRRNI